MYEHSCTVWSGELRLLASGFVTSELPDDALRWSAAERELAQQVLRGRTVVVNVRRGGPHRDLVPELLERIQSGELTGRALVCWCAPQACHADVLAAHVQRESP